MIGSSLEAAVEVRAAGKDLAFLKAYERDLPMVFIVSQVKLLSGGDAQSPVSVGCQQVVVREMRTLLELS